MFAGLIISGQGGDSHCALANLLAFLPRMVTNTVRISMHHVTQILDRAQRGDPLAASELLPLVYQELRRIAVQKMAAESPGHTLQPTALVHEAWLRLVGNDGDARFANRAHFFGAAAEAMRRILIDRARRKRAQRHGAGQQRLDIDEVEIAVASEDDQLLAIDEALDKLAERDKGAADLVKLRYFVGMTIEEAAQALGISETTANRDWAYARAWLFKEIESQSRKSRSAASSRSLR
jgi:RNA polymerase sigma factor (TIGR02999 family)